MFRNLLLMVSVVGIAACSTIVDGATQEVSVFTPGARDAKCTLFNGDFNYVVHPPQTLTISKRGPALQVSCDAFGDRRKVAVFDGKWNTSAWVNVANGLAPGLAVDYASGALYNYPTEIVIDFREMEAKREPYPDYHLNAIENPHVTGIEEFRHGVPSLMRDRYETIPEMDRRDPADRGVDTGLTIISGSEAEARAQAQAGAETTESAGSLADPYAIGPDEMK